MLFIFVYFCLGMLFCQAQPTNGEDVEVSTKIEAVKVHMQGAEVSRSGTLNIKEGRGTIIIKNLSSKIYGTTIQVALPDKVTLLSLTTQKNFLDQTESPEKVQELKDSVESIRDRLTELRNEYNAFDAAWKLLEKNYASKGKGETMSIEDLGKYSAYYQKEILRINKQKTIFSKRFNKWGNELLKYKLQLRELNAEQIPTSEIHLVVDAEMGVNKGDVKVSYVVGDCGWAPLYDVYATTEGKTVDLIYRGMAYNNTGIDWKDIALSLSTADPLNKAIQPQLDVWSLGSDYQGRSNQSIQAKQETQVVAYNRKKKYKSNYQINDLEGNFVDEFQNKSNIVYDYQKDVISITYASFIRDVMGQDYDNRIEYRASLYKPYIKTNENTTDIQFQTIELPELSRDFEIKERYTIPSDKKPYSIKIIAHQLNSRYSFYTVPKLEPNVYLLAELADWEDLYLINAPVNIFNNNKFIAKSYLNTNEISDTIYVSLGHNDFINTSHIKVKTVSKKLFLSNYKKETIYYDITVKNTTDKAININVLDQIPVSTDKDVVVELLEDSGAKLEAETGILSWNMNIAKGEGKTVRFGFSVKYPPGKRFSLKFNTSRSRRYGCPAW